MTFPVVLQRNGEISRDYEMFATPIGYLIDARGVISSAMAGIKTGHGDIYSSLLPKGGCINMTSSYSI